jgi:RNA polymerase sigma-70 factor (ECF subfamily)
MDTDRALLERWRAGDNSAGQDLYDRHFSDVFGFFDGKVGVKAEDLTKQTFLECLRSRDVLPDGVSFRGYLFGVAWSQLQRHLRQELRDDNVNFEVSTLNELSARVGSPSSQAERAHQTQYVHQALAHLPVAQQILLEYWRWQDIDDDSLAQIFAVPVAEIPKLLASARNALRKRLTGGAATVNDRLTTSLQELEEDDRRLESTEEKGTSP